MTAERPAESAPLRGIALMVAGIFVMSVMDALIKWLGASYPSIQIVLLRCIFGLIPLFAIVAVQGGPKTLRTTRPVAQALRAVFGAGAMVGFFYALSKMGLAETVTLAFSSPLFITLMSIPMLGEKVGPRRLAAVIVGFVGVLIVVRPGSEIFSLYALIPIAASFCFAMTMLLARKMADTETSVSMTFYTSIGGLIVGLIGAPAVWISPAGGDWPVFLVLGLLGGVGQFLVTASLRYAEAGVIAPFEYTALVWATLFGFVFWNEMPDLISIFGGVIVVGAGIYIGYRETRLHPKQTGPVTGPGPVPTDLL